MKLHKALKILDNHNKWRRGDDDYPMAHPTELGKAIDTVIKEYQNLYTTADVIKAGKMAEIKYLDTLHILLYLDDAKIENQQR